MLFIQWQMAKNIKWQFDVIKFIQRLFNHEIWHKCAKCNNEYDLRSSSYCDSCGHRWSHGDPI